MADVKEVKKVVKEDTNPTAKVRVLVRKLQAGMQSHEVQDIKAELAVELDRLEAMLT